MTVVNYLWNPINDNIVEEFDDAGNTLAENTTEPDQFGDVISQFRDGQESFYHTDGQSSTLALTNSDGDVTDTYAYSAFGEVTTHTGNTFNPFQYVGQKGYYRDQDTGDYEVRRRALFVKQGRWLSPEPMPAFILASNAFAYCDNKVILKVDPSGLIAIIPMCEDDKNKVNTSCGGTSRVRWTFSLENKSHCAGFLVQQVTVRCKILECLDKDCLLDFSKELDPVAVYLETWYVEEDKPLDIDYIKIGYTDLAKGSSHKGTCGKYSADGLIKFFCLEDIGDLRMTPSWKKDRTYGTGDCETSAEGLFSNGSGGGYDPGPFPEWFKGKGEEKAAERTFKLEWDCCSGCEKKNNVNVTAAPDPRDKKCQKVMAGNTPKDKL